jgi:hypothetical protein
MADTTYLKKTVEPFMVQWVSCRIRVSLEPKRVPVGRNTEGKRVHFAFDGVSEDGQVGVLVSASRTVKAGATRKLHVDASILLQAPFRRRIMAFISHDVQQNFINKCDGLLPLGDIEMLVCEELPPDMIRQLEQVQVEAKGEVGDKGKKWKPGGRRK